ncbi:MAG: nicotinate-nucleotide--dimethylbenzimidazole phosphoribosyltransferase [Methyloligellaceae bacterium]
MTKRIFKASTLKELAAILADLPVPDEKYRQLAQERQNILTKPPGSLGVLEEISVFLAGWQGTVLPEINKAQALVFAGNHGVCNQGVNPYPQEVTAQMVENFKNGGAAINQLCRENNADLDVVALDLDNPTKDFTQEVAMSETEVLAAMEKGATSVNSSADILLLGEMGIGNSTVAAALSCALFGGPTEKWVGPGTGSDKQGITVKINAINEGLKLHAGLIDDPLKLLCAFGGREQAAIAGAIIAARMLKIPVVLDGFICTAAAAVLSSFDEALDHCLVAHQSSEPGHEALLQKIQKSAILNLEMRLGEGSGAALSLGIIRSALACHNGMATFADAGISES